MDGLCCYNDLVMAATTHRHGRLVHDHPHRGPHRHRVRGRTLSSGDVGHTHGHGEPHGHSDGHGHSHGLIDPSIKRSREGLRAVALSLLVLGVAAAAQLVVFLMSNSVALLADLIHNFGDAATAIPVGAAFALRSARAERWAGLAVVFAIFVSACVAGVESLDRLLHPAAPEHLAALAGPGRIRLHRKLDRGPDTHTGRA